MSRDGSWETRNKTVQEDSGLERIMDKVKKADCVYAIAKAERHTDSLT